ncbi:hypothetical protein UCDDA912_g00037 [Diaporthe ampelina]|uniref:Uncharacterized protein n=1 Tax=Diaporthe ampelina TaxID=1214573 RepID=A0A0G2G1F7_9PEZI|nr:hypothetical protein UCDDA912_g00037 [Diaporthe ampelina]
MESIQLAQMLADISDLSAADKKAAAALVNANKALNQQAQAQAPNQIDGPKPPAPTAGASRSSPSVSNSRLDKFGRRILTPPMTRTNSAQGSMPGTPRGSDPEDDVDRASTLMALYDIRNKIKQQDNTSLIRAREKIDAMIAKQKAAVDKQGKQAGDASQTQERPRPTSRYTFPRPDATSNTEKK